MGEKFYFVFLDNEELNRLRFWIYTDTGRVMNFVVQYETFINSEWHPVVGYDLAHNSFHRDNVFQRQKRKIFNSNSKFKRCFELCGTGFKR